MDTHDSSHDFQYDAADQLIKSKGTGIGSAPAYNRALSYDSLGNRAGGNYVANFALSQDGITYTPDLFGFGETIKRQIGSSVVEMTNNALGLWASFRSGGINKNVLRDALDRPLAFAINDNGTIYNQNLLYVADTNVVLQGKAGDGTVTTYLEGQGVNEHLAEVSAAGAKSYVTNHLGSVLNSSIAGRWNRYGIWGEISERPELSVSSPAVTFGFAGYQWESVSGIYCMDFRCYDPQTARFLSQEPLGIAAESTNFYSYVNNKPQTLVDADGLAPIDDEGRNPREYVDNLIKTADPEKADTSSYLGTAAMTVGVAAVVVVAPRVVPALAARVATAAKTVAHEAFRKGGFLNSNQYFRIGFSRDGGDRVFRIAGKLVPTKDGHIILKNLGPLKKLNAVLPAALTAKPGSPSGAKNTCP